MVESSEFVPDFIDLYIFGNEHYNLYYEDHSKIIPKTGRKVTLKPTLFKDLREVNADV